MSVVGDDVKLALLARANKVLADRLSRDTTCIPDPGEVILGASSSSTYASTPNHAWAPYELRKTIMIPDELFSDYESTKSTCAMGVFPEIDRAWITLNNKLFLWDYITTKDSLQSFPEQDGTIYHVGLVKPKPGIFIDSMKYLLVICTPATLVVLGLATPDSPPDPSASSQDFVVYDTELRFPTENVQMISVVSTASGRVFMCGKIDGHLYEMLYQAKEGWFGGRSSLHDHSVSGLGSFLPSIFSAKPSDFITQLALDDSRGLLYALTSANTIILYSLAGPTPTALTRIATATNVANTAQSLGLPLGASFDKMNIASIHTIPASESNSIHLVGTTRTGARLYFTTLRRSYGGFGTTVVVSGNTPSTLELVHVRMGPSNLFDPRSTAAPNGNDSLFRSSISGRNTASGARAPPAWFPTNLSTTSSAAGLFIASQTSADDTEQDVLLCIAPDLPRIGNLNRSDAGHGLVPSSSMGLYDASQQQTPRSIFSEYSSLLPLSGKTWAISYLPPASSTLVSSSSSSSRPSTVPPEWNELISQFSSMPQQFLVLTTDGLSVVVKRRAVDCLKDLIDIARRGGGGITGGEIGIGAFFDLYGRDQACAMCLAIAASNSFVSSGISSLPAPSTALPSSRSGFGFSASISGMLSGSEPEDVLGATAKVMFQEGGGQPAIYPNASGVTFSGRHEGFAIYFSRLVRPIWKEKITKGPISNQSSNISVSVLSTLQRNLQSLKSFLDRNPQLFLPPGNLSGLESSTNDGQASAWKDEEVSATSLRELLGLTVEAISFILLLIDYKLPDTIALCEPALQEKLHSMTWEALLIDRAGRDVGRGLVTAIINQQISQQISIDTISEILQSRCPNFCSTDDVMMYKAIESLRRAKETRNVREKTENLQESLRLLLKSTRNLQVGNLEEICTDYRQMKFAEGAVVLPLKAANDWDADRQGYEYWLAGCPEQDPRKGAYDLRAKCYDFIIESIAAFDQQVAQATDESSAVDAEARQSNAYQLALVSDDAVFHSYFYDWFIAMGRTDQLLEIRTPFIEDHLRREPATWQKCELLWQFYVHQGQFLRAAETLADLAQTRDFGLKLDKRIEYLSLAVGNAKSHQTSDYESNFVQAQAPVEFLNDLEASLDVAHVQMEVYEAVQGFKNLDADSQAVVDALGRFLTDVNTLWFKVAEPFGMNDMKLLILKVSEYHDMDLVTATWKAIFAEAETSPQVLAERISRLGHKLYPSDIAFPVGLLCSLLEDFAWEHHAEIPRGWVPQVLIDANVPYEAIFNPLYQLREEGKFPYHTPERELPLIDDITILLSAWLDEALRPHSRVPRGSFPALAVDSAVETYLVLARSGNLNVSTETRAILEDVQKKVRSRF